MPPIPGSRVMRLVRFESRLHHERAWQAPERPHEAQDVGSWRRGDRDLPPASRHQGPPQGARAGAGRRETARNPATDSRGPASARAWTTCRAGARTRQVAWNRTVGTPPTYRRLKHADGVLGCGVGRGQVPTAAVCLEKYRRVAGSKSSKSPTKAKATPCHFRGPQAK
jgi:hypothetical protein